MLANRRIRRQEAKKATPISIENMDAGQCNRSVGNSIQPSQRTSSLNKNSHARNETLMLSKNGARKRDQISHNSHRLSASKQGQKEQSNGANKEPKAGAETITRRMSDAIVFVSEEEFPTLSMMEDS